MKITASELREKWLNFWKKKGHAIIPSASTIPDNDPTALFHNSGMHPLVPYLMGEKHPAGKRLANAQKCIRTGDIDEVGDATHLTFFEMLGNWSLGDYFKEEQIAWSWEFLTEVLKLPVEKLAVSVFAGDDDAPRDEEAAKKWLEMGIPAKKIAYLGKKDNWWAKGEIGPCGTDTEMFYWTGEGEIPANFQETHDDPRWVEIWNDVFMQYNMRSEEETSEEIQKNLNKTTEDIIGKAIQIHKKYQGGLTEKQIKEMLADKIRQLGHKVETEKTVEIIEDGKKYGNRYIDLVVNDYIFVELKNTTHTGDIKKGFKQLRSYLELGGGFAGLLLNFANSKIQINRLNNFESEHFKAFLQTSKLSPLLQRNIDTGMGLERTITVLNGLKSVYETDIFRGILGKIAEIAKKPEIIKNPAADTETGNSARIIADHLRTATVLLADKIVPSNLDQGYILRRLIRRAIRHGRKLGIKENFAGFVADEAIKSLQDAYPELLKNREFILKELEIEEKQFAKTLEQGEKEFLKLAGKIREFSNKKEISGKKAFWLYETFGFPVEMTIELAQEQGLTVDFAGFKEAEKKHQEASRAGAEKKFKGGLGDHSVETTRLHTATHLLHAGLRKVLGDHVEQRGSNITPERLRFDFSHPEKLTPEQIKAVEDYVNSAIKADAPVSCIETTVEDAKKQGAIGLFGDKYGEKVKMYTMGEFSREICGGPHVQRTGELGTFKIKKEQASSRGVRRIKAVLTP